ncbi:unnamed protein product [Camellia sinensis]
MGGGSSDLRTETSEKVIVIDPTMNEKAQVKYVAREREKKYRENERKNTTEKDKAEKHGAETHKTWKIISR